MMSVSRVCCPALLMALAAIAAGCADHPVTAGQHPGAAASSKYTRYGVPRKVLEAAADLGYRPRKFKGRIVFCQNESAVGSIIPKYRCVGRAALAAEIQDQRTALQRLSRANSGCYQSTCNRP